MNNKTKKKTKCPLPIESFMETSVKVFLVLLNLQIDQLRTKNKREAISKKEKENQTDN